MQLSIGFQHLNRVTNRNMPASTTTLYRKHSHTSMYDDLNSSIIKLLQQDGRMAYSAIAAELEVSEGAIRKRVNRLYESGAMRIVAVVDPMELSYDAYTQLGLRVSSNHYPEAAAHRLAKISEVVYAIWTSGPYDLLVEVIFEDRDRFAEFLSTEIYAQPDVKSCEVMQTIKVIKNQYQLKPDFNER